MAHTVKSKDKIIQSKVLLSRLSPPNAEDVNPTPQFSQKLPHDPKYNPSKLASNPFVNIQVTIANDSKKKRKLDDTSCNIGVSGDYKKPSCKNALSPDLGCFMDISSPLSGRVSASTFDQSAEEYFEGDDDVLIIGDPIFESSVCQPSATAEQRSQLMDVLKEPVSYSVDVTSVDTSYETTLPLPVQVKSKVVVRNVPENIKKQASPPPQKKTNKKKRKKTAQRAESERSKICDELEWDRQKQQYVFSVRGHMTENEFTTQGHITELQDLMTLVDGQTGSSGSKWQHPSDLTCRNYQWRFCNEKPWMTLSEWQAKNLTNHKRFSNVPKIFERSPFP